MVVRIILSIILLALLVEASTTENCIRKNHQRNYENNHLNDASFITERRNTQFNAFHKGGNTAFKSVCLRCTACLTIAQQMNKSLKGFHQNHKHLEPLQREIGIKELLNSVCNDNFANYDLRNYSNYKILSNNFCTSSHLQSDMNGKWPKLLKDICLRYVLYADIPYLYHLLSTKQPDTGYFFCREMSVFNDCRNLNLSLIDDNPIKCIWSYFD